ncbi:MAG: hypothetical protein AAGD05_09295 [Bacteroidota bacterium]
MATKTAKKVTKRTTKSATNEVNVNFTESFNKIKDTAISVNSQVLDTAADVIDDLKVNGEQLRDVAVKNVKETINKVTETINMENVKETAKNINDYTLKTADEIVEGAIENGEKWQGIASKAVKGGLKLAAKQQDMMFTTLETVKDQMANSALRFKKLLKSNN